MTNLIIRLFFRLILTHCVIIFPVEVYGQNKFSKKEVFDFFPSDHVAPRRVDVYLPPGYPSEAPYNVLFMHDGQNLSDDSTSTNGKSWRADSTLFKLMSSKEVPPTILVGVWNSRSRHREYAPMPCFSSLSDSSYAQITREYGGIPYSDRYLTFLVDELKPLIDSRYKTAKGPQATSIIGSSMGGLISLYAICRYPNIFGSAGCVSTHWPILTNVKDVKLFNNLYAWLPKQLPNDGQHRVYFDHGSLNQDSLYAPYQIKIDELFRKIEFDKDYWNSMYFEGESHNEASWSFRLSGILKYVLAGKKD